MSKTVTGYLIDPVARTVTAVHVQLNGERGGLDDIYKHTGCDCVDAARYNEAGDCVFVDDEGLLKGPQAFFIISGYPHPLAGRGIALGIDDEGETTSPTESLADFARHVWFVDLLVAGNPVVVSRPHG